MSTNHTQNYNLSQWERTDKVLMEDFNADNAKIDAALKAEADARSRAVASLASQLAGKGNCRVVYQTYAGTGSCGADNPTTLSFPGQPVAVFIMSSSGLFLPVIYPMETVYAYGVSGYITSAKWIGSTLQIMNYNSSSYQMNDSRCTYSVVALIAN